MTATNHGERPSVRQALFGNDHAANFRCAVKWSIWQGFYLLIATAYGLYKAVDFLLYGFLGPIVEAVEETFGPYFNRAAAVLPLGSYLAIVVNGLIDPTVYAASALKTRLLNLRDWLGRNAERFAQWLREGWTGWAGLRILMVMFSPVVPVVFLLVASEKIDERTGVFTGTKTIVLFIVLTILDFFFGWGKQTKDCTVSGARRFVAGTREKAKEMQEKPGTQRIYGYCPVSFDITPKWFESLDIDLTMPWHKERGPIEDGCPNCEQDQITEWFGNRYDSDGFCEECSMEFDIEDGEYIENK